MGKVKISRIKQNQGVYSTPMGSYIVVRTCDKHWDPEIADDLIVIEKLAYSEFYTLLERK